jgi:hypothetical protein
MQINTAGWCLLPLALSALSAACVPDSSLGSDSVGTQAGTSAMSPGQAGSNALGGSGGAATTSGTSGSTSIAGSVANTGSSGSASTTGGSGSAGAGPAMAGSGGAPASSTAGAGPVGSAGMGGPSLCPVAGTTLCDGFEGAAPGATGSDWKIKGTAISVDTTKSYRGTKSVKYAAADTAYIVETKTFTGSTKMTNNAMWGRYFVLAGVSAYPTGHTVFGTLADAADADDPGRFHFVGGSRQKLMAEIRVTGDTYTDKGGKEASAAAPPFPVVADNWKCWEFHVTADDSFSFYIDGTEVTDMQIVKGKATASGAAFALPVFGQLQLGWQSFVSGSPVVTGWIDEVAIGPTRIGCGS